MIKFQNVAKIYPPPVKHVEPIIALEDVSFNITGGEFISVVGKSGAGKTTLLKLLFLEERATKGRIFFEDQDIHKIKNNKIPYYRQSIGLVFQDYKLLASKNVYENIAFAMEVIGATDEEIKRDVRQVLEIVGLEERVYNFPHELSGGEKQRVAIARALIHRPKVLCADEPTGNLDPYNTLDILKLLMKINETGTTVILASHDREIINFLQRRVITLEKGKIIRDEEKGKFIL